VRLRPASLALLTAGVVLASCSGGNDAAPATVVPATTTVVPATTTVVPATTANPPAATMATGTTAVPATLPAPEGDAFYLPPDPLPGSASGDLIWARPLTGLPTGKGWQILYRSETVAGDPIAVSGIVAVPEAAAAVPRPILAWAHGTTGLGDQCAPSKAFAAGTAPELALLPQVLAQGYAVVATDYEGLGTPGVHPYAVGLSEGRGVLDAIRATQRLPGTGADATSPAVVWGHSQGGGAAAFAAELAPTYAPDANVVGAVAGAPAAELKALQSSLRTSPFFGYTFMAAAGFQAAYPDLDLTAGLTPEGIAAVEAAGAQCASETIAAHAGQDPARYLTGDPATTEPFASLLEDNTPGNRPTDVAIFLYQGEADEQIPVELSGRLLERYCALGVTASRRTYPGQSHAGVIGVALPDIERFITDRLAGLPAPSSC
jgi:predicted esterase